MKVYTIPIAVYSSGLNAWVLTEYDNSFPRLEVSDKGAVLFKQIEEFYSTTFNIDKIWLPTISQEKVIDTFDDGERIIYVVYSIFFSGHIGINENQFKWTSIKDLDNLNTSIVQIIAQRRL